MNAERKADFTDRARVEYLCERQEVDRLAEAAAAWFAAHPQGWTYSDGKVDGQLLALRWGAHGRAVFVCRVDEGFPPVIYADLVPESAVVPEKGRPAVIMRPGIAVRPPEEDGNCIAYDGTDADREAMDAAIATYSADRSTANWWAMVTHIEAWQAWLREAKRDATS